MPYRAILIDTATNAVSNVTDWDITGSLKINGVTVLTGQCDGVENSSENLAELTGKFNQLLENLRAIKLLSGSAGDASSSSSSSDSSASSLSTDSSQSSSSSISSSSSTEIRSSSSSSSQSSAFYCGCDEQECIDGSCTTIGGPWFSSYDILNIHLNNSDNCKLYFHITNTGGGEAPSTTADIRIYKDAARTQLVMSKYAVATYVGLVITPDMENSSGLSGTITWGANVAFAGNFYFTIGCELSSSSNS